MNIRTWFQQLVCKHEWKTIDTQRFSDRSESGQHIECFGETVCCVKCGKYVHHFERVYCG